MSIKIQELSKSFSEQKAVDSISFEIKSGNIVGFLGPNGAGKSTTMKMLTTYIPPTSGTAFICDFDIIKNPLEVRQHVGYLPEKNPLYDDMYVKEYLEFAAGVHQLGKLKNSRVDEMISLTGLEKEIKKKIGALSKGYKQRIGLAQAMIHHPSVLILDEPTSGLDPNQILEIRDLILDIGKERTVLLSTHIMQEVKAMCSRVIIINNGKIVADDDIASLEKQTDGNVIFIEFDKEVSEKQLSVSFSTSLSAILQINAFQWTFTTSKPETLRKEIMKWSLENGINITTLRAETKSLETAFRDLTK